MVAKFIQQIRSDHIFATKYKKNDHCCDESTFWHRCRR